MAFFVSKLMKTNNLLLLIALLLVSTFQAQITIKKNKEDNDIKLSTLPYYSFGKGIGITSPDSIFNLNIRFRLQNRITYYNNEDENESYEGQIRRLRLRFDGYVGNPKFLYAIQLSFAPGDVGELKDGENINIIRDAVVMYRPNKKWNISFGQTKLPGNRQRVNSSGALQLSDRSINNSKFTIDRDFGIQIHQMNEYKDKFSYNLKAAASTGEGRNITGNADTGLAFTGKVEVLPFGSFKKDGTYFEGDILRETKPKLMVSAAFQQNNRAMRTQGQLGNDLYEERTMKSVLADMMFKYNGWAAMMSYMSRATTKNPVTYSSDLSNFNYVFTGNGFDYQLSYAFKNKYEFIGRYSIQSPNKAIQLYAPKIKQYTLGVTKYIWEHSFKLQAEVSYDNLLNNTTHNTKDNVYVRFQVEMGI